MNKNLLIIIGVLAVIMIIALIINSISLNRQLPQEYFGVEVTENNQGQKDVIIRDPDLLGQKEELAKELGVPIESITDEIGSNSTKIIDEGLIPTEGVPPNAYQD